MKSIRFRGSIGIPIALLSAVVFTGCGEKVDDTSLMLPRGSTISVRTQEELSTRTHGPGDGFPAVLDAPLRRDREIYVPIGSSLAGVVEDVTKEADSAPAISIRLTSLQLPSGSAMRVETKPITRLGRTGAGMSASLTPSTGLEDKISYLAGGNQTGTPDTASSVNEQLEGVTTIPNGTQLVFTLDENLVIPRAAK